MLLDNLFEASLDLVQINMLIPWFHFDLGHEWFYRAYESDHPLDLGDAFSFLSNHFDDFLIATCVL